MGELKGGWKGLNCRYNVMLKCVFVVLSFAKSLCAAWNGMIE